MNRVINTLHLRLWQGVLGAVNLGISAYSVHVYARSQTSGAPDSLDFLLFISCFALSSLLYLGLVPRLAPRAAPACACLAVEIFNTVLYLGALIAYAYFLGSLTICSGRLCAVNRANSVVAAVAFCAWIGSAALSAKDLMIARARIRRPSATSTDAKDAHMRDLA